MIVIDGEKCVLGRLASVTSKNLLEGEEVVVLNAEKIMLTGNKDWAYAKYKQRVDRASISNPRDLGPKYPRRPDDIFRRTVRGMLPFKKSKGKTAFKGLKAFVVYLLNMLMSNSLQFLKQNTKILKKVLS